MADRTRDRRTRYTFWIDDRIVDEFGPVMGRYPSGTAALAVYTILARRADRDGDSWPSVTSIAQECGISASTVHRALRLLEVLELVAIATCYEAGSQRQTSNLYTLLTPPDPIPAIDPDPKQWPPPRRRTLLVRGANRSGTPPSSGGGHGGEAVAAARLEQRGLPGQRPAWAGLVPDPSGAPPCHHDTPSPITRTPSPCRGDTLPPVMVTPLEGNTDEGNTRKEGSRERFLIAEAGLTNGQVWAATLAELLRRDEVGQGEVETWLRPAALVGREGQTLIVGAPNAVARDRIARRLLPAVRNAIAATVGAEVDVSVVVEKGRDG